MKATEIVQALVSETPAFGATSEKPNRKPPMENSSAPIYQIGNNGFFLTTLCYPEMCCHRERCSVPTARA